MNDRSRISMSPAEIAAFLSEQRTINLGTLGRDGAIHIVAMWFTLIDGDPAMWAYQTSQKVRNLERDRRLSGLVEAGETYLSLRGVELIGQAELVDSPEAVGGIGARLHAKYGGDSPGSDIAVAAAKRVGIVLRPTRVISWDHRKLA